LLLLADTVAAHQIGGFKVGVSFALRKCRDCLATASDMSTKVCNAACIYMVVYITIALLHSYITLIFLVS